MQPVVQVPKIQSAHAVLVLDGDYVLQLRDNEPTIASPGQWSLFGGKMEVEETPLQTIEREVCEELSIEGAEFRYLWYVDFYASFESTIIRTWFFASDVTAVWPDHKLREGKAVRAFRFEELARLEMPQIMYRTIERFHRQRKGSIQDTRT